MKKTGVLHTDLSFLIASMGHKDMLVIGDAGLPVPPNVTLIDLALRNGVPGFLETLETILGELAIEKGITDEEQLSVSPAMAKDLERMWPSAVPLERVPHAKLQELVKQAKAVVRTGEFTAYSNVILVAGVVF